MSGGAGYVMSREALRRMAKEVIAEEVENKEICHPGSGGAEDLNLGNIFSYPCHEHISFIILFIRTGTCLQQLNVTIGESRDDTLTPRFFPFPPGQHLVPRLKKNEDFWYWNYSVYQRDVRLCRN